MLARTFTGLTVEICPGALIVDVYYRKEGLERFISLGFLA